VILWSTLTQSALLKLGDIQKPVKINEKLSVTLMHDSKKNTFRKALDTELQNLLDACSFGHLLQYRMFFSTSHDAPLAHWSGECIMLKGPQHGISLYNLLWQGTPIEWTDQKTFGEREVLFPAGELFYVKEVRAVDKEKNEEFKKGLLAGKCNNGYVVVIAQRDSLKKGILGGVVAMKEIFDETPHKFDFSPFKCKDLK